MTSLSIQKHLRYKINLIEEFSQCQIEPDIISSSISLKEYEKLLPQNSELLKICKQELKLITAVMFHQIQAWVFEILRTIKSKRETTQSKWYCSPQKFSFVRIWSSNVKECVVYEIHHISWIFLVKKKQITSKWMPELSILLGVLSNWFLTNV